jgi:signal transduction histidine kinase
VRLDEARARDAGGAGLGLAIVESVGRGHGGSARVTDRADGTRGARFELRLGRGTDGGAGG